jgi:hypothetical protein
VTKEQIIKRLQRLVNANQLMAQELSDLQRELGLTTPVPRTRQRLKKQRKNAMEIKLYGKPLFS